MGHINEDATRQPTLQDLDSLDTVVRRRYVGLRRLCVVCGHRRACLTLARDGHAPARLCLRCHHAVMRQRRRLHGDAGLVVPRGAGATNTAKYEALTHRRRRAQVAARRALEPVEAELKTELRKEIAARQTSRRVRCEDLFDRAS